MCVRWFPLSPMMSTPCLCSRSAGYHVQKDMLTFLQSEKADFDMGNMESGSPLIQMMIYAYIKQTEEGLSSPQIDVSIVKFFTDHGTVLSRVLMAPEYDKSTALELAISFQQLDIVQVLIEAGADPILCGDGVVSPLLVEYTLFGTFSFIRWLLENHLGQSKIPGFIDRLLETGVLFRDNMKNTVMEVYGRSPAHAFLLCRHKEAIDYLVQRRRELLEECDPFGRTALHLAAEEGDLESVRILLDCNADIEVEDKSLMTPLMLATKNEHEEVVREIEMFASRAGKSEDPMGLWAWALQHGYTSYFETLHRTHELEEVLKKPIDSNGNTIAHVAAEGNHVSVFKTTFPKTKSSENLYEILMIQNSRNKTPLQLAIDNGNVGILTGLQERKKEREKAASRTEDWSQKQVVSVEKREWKDFWDIESPGLLLYACSHGTVETVKYFTTRLVPPTTRYADGLTPLSVAAKAGKHEIVAYLLSIPGVSAEGVAAEETRGEVEKQHSPLMLASKYGHSKCVQLLLEKEADIGVVSDRGYNCLMESIDRGHKSVAVTFVTDSKTWKGSMRHCVPEDGRFLTPIRMLIESMPGVSKMVLTKCVEPPTRHSQEVVYDFEFIEDYVQPSSEPRLELQSGGGATTPESFQFSRLSTPSSGGTASGSSQGHRPRGRDAGRRNLIKPSDYKGLEHPLMLMVKNERLDLLKHPLIRRYIHYKWWRISFPVFLTVLSLYVLFLVFLASFSLLIPRPGPESTYCPSNDTTAGYTQDNLGAGVCKGMC
ncbi:Transient receptor potential cation channel subfamily A member 1 homolog [Geodia barretti]|uniref:Transient receptor potential cation channel subfamily A member 1 homolog n=1 Tax=Geodia barretti TaxID=519541 RepID=A0AA35RT58_GEOBA|nr:Transient receptor potential cation channel subfamily A member 1 homolog [Geodia barretti]